jgi:hypothetical protein
MRGFLFGIAAVVGIGVAAPAEAQRLYVGAPGAWVGVGGAGWHYHSGHGSRHPWGRPASHYDDAPLAYYLGRPVRLHSRYGICQDFVPGPGGVWRRMVRCW